MEYEQGWINWGDRRDRSPRAPEISSLGRDRGGPDIFTNGSFWLTLWCFLAVCFFHTLYGPFWRLGPFSVRAPKTWSPHRPPLRNSFLQAWIWGVGVLPALGDLPHSILYMGMSIQLVHVFCDMTCDKEKPLMWIYHEIGTRIRMPYLPPFSSFSKVCGRRRHLTG